MFFPIAIVLLLGLLSPGWAGQIHDAMAAYKKGNYPAALEMFRPLAMGGDQIAQTVLGMMYQLGQGVAENNAEAAKWYL